MSHREFPSPEPVLVRGLTDRAEAVDGVAPLSEAFLLALGTDRVHHVVRYAGDGALAAYAQSQPDGSAELVVDPGQRRQGHGRALVEELLDHDPATRVWAHGDLPAARALAASAGLRAVRELHLMGRALAPADREAPVLPEGVVTSTYAERPDLAALHRLNAAAFASHPEQGRLSADDLEERMAQPWFDPAGLLWLLDAADGEPVAFHWTKVEPGSDVGEVYVVGVDPARQGRGLAGPLTALGLAHLAGRGLAEVHLYVDGDNAPALATYRRAGFTDLAVDVMYAVRERSVQSRR